MTALLRRGVIVGGVAGEARHSLYADVIAGLANDGRRCHLLTVDREEAQVERLALVQYRRELLTALREPSGVALVLAANPDE